MGPLFFFFSGAGGNKKTGPQEPGSHLFVLRQEGGVFQNMSRKMGPIFWGARSQHIKVVPLQTFFFGVKKGCLVVRQEQLSRRVTKNGPEKDAV